MRAPFRRPAAGLAAGLALSGCGVLQEAQSPESREMTRAVLSALGLAFPGRIVDDVESDAGFRMIRGVALPRGTRPDACGPGVLAAVMNHWSDPVTVYELEGIGLRYGEVGMLPPEMVAVANRRGFVGQYERAAPPRPAGVGETARRRPERGSIGQIKEAIDDGKPPILALHRGPYGHAMVAVGYSDRVREVAFAELEARLRLIAYDDLAREWERAGGFFLVLAPASAAELCERGDRALKARAWHDAERCFQLATAREPAFAGGHLGMGDLRLLQGRTDEAEAWYRNAADRDPSSTRAVNNVAHLVLSREGPPGEAVGLAERAVALAEAEWGRLWRAHEAADLPAAKADLTGRLHRVMLEHLTALGTLGQARRAAGDGAGAIAAWRAGLTLAPEAMRDYRALRMFEIATAMGEGERDAATDLLREAMGLAGDPALRDRITEALGRQK